MKKSENKKETSMADKRKFPTNRLGANNLPRTTNILQTKTIQNTQRTMMSKANTHRKNRNSREKCSESEETLHINTSARTSTKFGVFSSSSSSSSSWSSQSSLPSSLSLSLSLFRPNRFGYSVWQRVVIISVLVLVSSTKVSFATTQNSHSTLIAIAAAATATPTATSTTMPPTFVATSSSSSSSSSAATTSKYSQQFTAEDSNNDNFRPIIPKDISMESISKNIFTKDGQYRIFQPVDSDLRATLAMKVPQFPAENSKSFNERREVTLQTKRKTLSTENPEILSMKGSIRQQETQTFMNDKTKESQKPGVTVVQTKSNQNRPEKTQDQRRRIFASPKQFKQMPSSVFGTTSTPVKQTDKTQEVLATEIKDLQNLLADYVDDFFNKGQYQPKPELIFALQQNFTEMSQGYKENVEKYAPTLQKRRPVRQVFEKRADGEISMNIPRAFESGRLLFFAGLKKVMWPIYMGLQVLKSLMFALLLPTLIGSFGKLLGKGISSGSAPLFIRPMDEPQDLDFRDNNFNFDDDSNKFASINDAAGGGGGAGGGNVKDGGYAYNQAEASQTHNQYAYNAASINQQALSRYGINERQQLMQDSYLSALQSLGAASFKTSNGISGSSSGGGSGGNGGGGIIAGLVAPMRQKPPPPANINTFQQFQKVPASSLLLSNYDPFYSPLLSRLDSVFAQLKLNSEDEACREKLICLMYANPAKYAPYSNLVSAQLSRELNELRKPTSDNPDILRFFKYMRAAKDGQDGIDCEKSFDKCKEFKDFENPAMVSTYHDINKLVQARKLS